MASMKSMTILLFVALSMIVVSEALILCPMFPSCCNTRSCHMLCPSCREARFFRNGVRLMSKFMGSMNPLFGNPINPDPFAIPGMGAIFPSAPLVI